MYADTVCELLFL